MLSCKEATRLMSEKLDRPLAKGEKVSLKMHLLMCKGCRQFDRQMGFIHQACQRISGQDGSHE